MTHASGICTSFFRKDNETMSMVVGGGSKLTPATDY
jgi:hypothetical protein